ncbi:BRO family protein [uncultured Bilophila sp.]|uniref:BRO-N domain-containing protein n=1 Tax=uncultured Bilophila sp. TaxID=529385 RepID=UPI00280BC824|nr:BRO family protein [uncultured Bilophila sp.]
MSMELAFNDVQFDVIPRDGQPWVTSRQLAQALGYKDENSVRKIYERNKDEFSPMMTATVNMTVGLTEVIVRIFSMRGCHLIGMFARTPVAKAFRRWVLDVIEQYGDRVPVERPISLTPSTPDDRKPLRDLANVWARLSGVHPSNLWPQVRARFQLERIDDLPLEWLPDALAWVQGKIDELGRKPLEEKKALPPAQRNLPAPAPYLDETPFLKFVEEIQSAHEEVRNILQPLMSNSFNLCLELGLELGRRSGMRSGSIKGMDPTRNLTDLLQHAIFSDLRQALIYPERHLADYANPGYALLGIVRQLNAR